MTHNQPINQSIVISPSNIEKEASIQFLTESAKDWRIQIGRLRKAELDFVFPDAFEQFLRSLVLILRLALVALWPALLALLRQLRLGLRFRLTRRRALLLQLTQLLLLLLKVLGLFRALLREHLLELRIVAAVVVEFLLVQVHDIGADVVEEALVVGHNEQGLFPAT